MSLYTRQIVYRKNSNFLDSMENFRQVDNDAMIGQVDANNARRLELDFEM